MKKAMRQTTSKLGKTIDLPKNSLLLDAGCEVGATAFQLNTEFGYRIEGIDILDFNITQAKRKKNELGIKDVKFSIGDYHSLKYKNSTFDGAYTIETLVHATDYKKALSELYRVLKPGGKLVLFEYSMPKKEAMNAKQSKIFQNINTGSVMHSFKYFIHESFRKLLTESGFQNVEVTNITNHIAPMAKRFHQLAFFPYQFVRLFGLEQKFVNTTAGYELHKNLDVFRYNIITADKPRK